MRKVAGPLRINLAQFRELEAFAEFGAELDSVSAAQLERGKRVVEVLKQRQFSPVSIEDQVVSIYAVTNGFMDDIPVEAVGRFEEELHAFLRSRHGALLDVIGSTGSMPEGDKLDVAISGFKEIFEA